MDNVSRSTARSFSGCGTCRRRKVKCDEQRPRCGPCTRLNKACDWARQWRFVNSNYTVERQYIVTDKRVEKAAASSKQPDSAVEWSSELQTYTSTGSDSYQTDSSGGSPSSPESSGGREDSSLALTARAPAPSISSRTNIVNTTPTSNRASRHELNELPVRLAHESDDEDSDQTLTLNNPSRQEQPWDSPRFDIMDYGTRTIDNQRHPYLFDTVICKKIMPMAVRFRLNIENNENLLLSTARRFPPLHHAICAITLLNSGLNNRPELLAGSFQHYDRAVSACRNLETYDPEATFFLHFILLMYDIGCASQRWPQDRTCWALHLQGLASLVHSPSSPSISRLKAYLSWYTLLLDSQAGLAGNEEAGHYVRSFLNNGKTLPLWPIAPSGENTFPSATVFQNFLAVHKLSLLIFQMYAEQSQLTLDMRRDMKAGTVNQAERQARVDDLSARHRELWEKNCPRFADDPEDPCSLEQQPAIIQGTFSFSRYQFSVLSLYLHSSMYPHQRLESDRYEDEDATHCSVIIKAARASVANADTENHHLAPGLFIAGFVSKNRDEKQEALRLLRQMSQAGLSGAVRRVYHLLDLAIIEQRAAENAGGRSEDVDWIEWSRKYEFKHIVLGM
ncbi:hypothetical protein BDZ85DRAFT_265728 [Elsinoe ampelina]|uniref:Zn(2)-C6 fungal-type domain-containing protein n=1 Tax=Elsinoe ampelina TaxID=302913 RepID=A0A6A6G7T2_9PEZI|nr:hypothetical protein BDZ85DRAFT_265728 [Elsinoe ampelina]